MRTFKYTSINNKERYVAVWCNEVVDIKSEAHRKRLEYTDKLFKWSQKELIKHKNTPTKSVLLPGWIRLIRHEQKISTSSKPSTTPQ